MIVCAVVPLVINIWQVLRIGALRDKYKVECPDNWSQDHRDFNIAQRTHGSTLELLPFYFCFLLLAGLKHPVLATACGLVFIQVRV